MCSIFRLLFGPHGYSKESTPLFKVEGKFTADLQAVSRRVANSELISRASVSSLPFGFRWTGATRAALTQILLENASFINPYVEPLIAVTFHRKQYIQTSHLPAFWSSNSISALQRLFDSTLRWSLILISTDSRLWITFLTSRNAVLMSLSSSLPEILDPNLHQGLYLFIEIISSIFSTSSCAYHQAKISILGRFWPRGKWTIALPLSNWRSATVKVV